MVHGARSNVGEPPWLQLGAHGLVSTPAAALVFLIGLVVTRELGPAEWQLVRKVIGR